MLTGGVRHRMRNSGRGRKVLKVALWILVGLVVAVGGVVGFDQIARNAQGSLTIGCVDFSGLPDGTYTGMHSGGRWSNQVLVTVESGRVTGIDVVKDVLFNLPDVTQRTLDAVIETQSLEVDIISGATVTARAYLKAVENALAGVK